MSQQENLEVEIKLKPTVSNAVLRRTLRALGYQVSVPRSHERNVLFDTPELQLRHSRQLLRIRSIRKKSILTFKGAPQNGKHKTREEIELEVSDPAQLELIFGRLGYREVFRYEKFRTEFRKPGDRGVITLDETPIGLFLELEGAPDWIDRAASGLGFQESDYLTDSYAKLYQAWCAERGIQSANMSFAGTAGGVVPKGL
jgi:adenylate cyclase class 2